MNNQGSIASYSTQVFNLGSNFSYFHGSRFLNPRIRGTVGGRKMVTPGSAIDWRRIQINYGTLPSRRRSSCCSWRNRTCKSGVDGRGRSRIASGSRHGPCRRRASSYPCSGNRGAWTPPRSSRGPWRRQASGRGPRPRRSPTIPW